MVCRACFLHFYTLSLFDPGYERLVDEIKVARDWQKIGDMLTDANFHSVAGYLVESGLYDPAFTPLQWSMDTLQCDLPDGHYNFRYYGFGSTDFIRRERAGEGVVIENGKFDDITLVNMYKVVLEVHNVDVDGLNKIFVERLDWNGSEFDVFIGS